MTTPDIRRRWLFRAGLVLVLLVIVYSGLRADPVPEWFYGEDKLNHVLAFAALATCLRLAFPRHSAWWQALAMLALGVAIELVQELLPARTGSLWDVAADVIGIALGMTLARMPFLRRLGQER